MKNRVIEVQNIPVSISKKESDDYICITDIAKAKIGESRSADVVKNWLRNRNTLEFLGTWEMIYNPEFKVVEFDHFKSEAGLHTFVLSAAEWINKTNAIGLYVKRGSHGGTYAYKDIAFEFASSISPIFKLYLIKEFQRFKEKENNLEKREWNAKRFLSKNNYLIQTSAVKNYLLPQMNYRENLQWLAYAEEADILNVALFGFTAKAWREVNPELANKNNVRDFASINELTVLSNLESHNAQMIREGKGKEERFKNLQEIAQYQLNVLNTAEQIRHFRSHRERCAGSTYWQINDTYPTISWATLDYYGRWKGAHYVVKRSYGKVISYVETGADRVARLYVSSDETKPLKLTCRLELIEQGKGVLHTECREISAEPLASTCVAAFKIQEMKELHSRECYLHYEIQCEEEVIDSGNRLLERPKKFHFLDPHLTSYVEEQERADEGKAGENRVKKQFRITVKAQQFARRVAIEFTDTDVILSDNYFDLLPGESKTVWVEEIRSEKEINQKTLSEEIVLTSNYDVPK
jgi:hypothetical protein